MDVLNLSQRSKVVRGFQVSSSHVLSISPLNNGEGFREHYIGEEDKGTQSYPYQKHYLLISYL